MPTEQSVLSVEGQKQIIDHAYKKMITTFLILFPVILIVMASIVFGTLYAFGIFR
jgi:t-SNARE complex subunit (syntaxin)